VDNNFSSPSTTSIKPTAPETIEHESQVFADVLWNTKTMINVLRPAGSGGMRMWKNNHMPASGSSWTRIFLLLAPLVMATTILLNSRYYALISYMHLEKEGLYPRGEFGSRSMRTPSGGGEEGVHEPSIAKVDDEARPLLTRKTNQSKNIAAASPKFFTWTRNNFTFTDFPVAGVNLASFGLAKAQAVLPSQLLRNPSTASKPFELFEDFNLADQLLGNETWKDLVALRRVAQRRSLSFYVDKVARKRWLPTVGVPSPKAHLLMYASEVTQTGQLKEEEKVILKHLPPESDYAAKPTHLSCSGGVWLTKYDASSGTTLISHGTKPFQLEAGFKLRRIAESLAKDLHESPQCGRQLESWALENVKPGVMIEERFTNIDGSDDSGGMEFKVVTIWGRVWLAQWRPGTSKVRAFLRRDGSTLQWDEEQSHDLPDWINWPRIVDLAEQLGRNKDMFRTDIFVGVPAGALRSDATQQERLNAVQYVVSECEVHPTPLKGCDEIFAEAGRLWLAGYRIGNYKIVPNTEVPSEFLESGMIAVRDQ
jgi:hypothetical protein